MHPTTRQTSLRGIHPILYAFFNKDGTIDAGAMAAQANMCIEAGAHGIVILGVVTETSKMNMLERLKMVDVIGTAIDGRVPFAVTVAEPNIEGQNDFVVSAKDGGADWVILQAPQIAGFSQGVLVDFLGQVANCSPLPIAIQNNPVNMAVSLTNDSLQKLFDDHECIKVLKADGSANSAANLRYMLNGDISIFGGQGGLEMLTQLRYGFDGFIPAPDCVAHQVRIFELWETGEAEAQAEATTLFKEILPLIVYMTRDLNGSQLALGKHRIASKLCIETTPRSPFVPAKKFALDELSQIAGAIDPFRLESRSS